MTRRLLAALIALVLIGAAACSSDDGGDVAAGTSSTTASTTTTTVEPDDGDDGGGDDETRARALRLVEDLEESSIGASLGEGGGTGEAPAGLDDPELEACALEFVLDNPELLEVDFDSLQPTDPAAQLVVDMLVSCVPRETFTAMLTEELSADMTPAAAACVEAELTALTDAEFEAFLRGAVAEDMEAILPVITPCAGEL